MKKSTATLMISIIAAGYLVGCSSSNPDVSSSVSASTSQSNEELSLFSDKSRIVGAVKPDPNNPIQPLPELVENFFQAPLHTYHLRGKGDVPYVEMSQLAASINTAFSNIVEGGWTTEAKEDGLHLYTADKKGELILDAAKDEIKIKNGQAFARKIVFENNGVQGDYCSFRDESIRDSEKTKVYKVDGSELPEYEVQSFKDYNFDIYQKDGKYYVPMEAFSKVLFRDIGFDIAYNGSEFYSTLLTTYNSSLFFSSNGYFKGYSGIFSPIKAGEGEAYRFQYVYKRVKESNPNEEEEVSKFLVLRDDESKSGYFFSCIGKEFNPAATIADQESEFAYSWRKEGNLLIVRVVAEGNPIGEYQIHLDKTRFLSDSVSSEVSEYNYNIMRYMFDKIYGLKEIKGYSNAESYFTSLGVKDGLKSTSIQTYNAALSKLLGEVDDGHTSHTALSIMTSLENSDSLALLGKSNVKDRVKSLYEKKTQYSKARIDKFQELYTDAGGNPDPNFYQGIKFSTNKETAVITFDNFLHGEEKILNMEQLIPLAEVLDEESFNIRTRSALINSSPNGFSTAFHILKQLNKTSKVVKNVVIDLTNNGGGMIAVMPYLAAFFTDDPTYVIQDTVNGTVREFHYKVDLNGDGVFGGAGDTFKNDFNFYFLTSGFSFSCGNCLPGMGKEAGVKVIGERSGGGTSPVGVYYDALGSAFNISNFYNMSYKGSDGKYMQNDSGIPLDYEFPLQNGNWYDPNAINTFIHSISNGN